jgi:Caspase domain
MRTALRPTLFSFALLLAVATSPVEAQKRRALLVGIDDYSASRIPKTGTPGRPRWSNLEGAINDVQAMREMLIAKYGFRSEDVKVLTNQAATREAILEAIRRSLVAPARRGDEIVFFYAGHGSQVVNSASDEPDKKDETLVPADSRAGAPDIRDKDLRPLFNQILDKGARLTVLLDSCHSASGARGLPSRARARVLPLDPRDIKDGRDVGPRPEDRGALILSAAQDDQLARETAEQAGKIHGAFSLALLEAMGRSGPRSPVEQVFLRAKARLQTSWSTQEPVLAGDERRREQPFFGGPDQPGGDRIVAAVQRVEADGTIRLQGGWATGLREGNVLELRQGDAARVRLEVTAVNGPVSSGARLLQPSRTQIRPLESGDLFELSGWTVSSEPSLRVWIPDAGSRWEAILQEVREMRSLAESSGFRWVLDPVEETPTHTLSWENEAWHLIAPTGEAERLGTGPAPAALFAKLASSQPPVRLFVHLPAPPDLARTIRLGAGTQNSAVERTSGPQGAHYSLVGRWDRGVVEFAWVRPATGDDEKRPLPARTDWQPLSSNPRLEDPALLIAKIQDWLNLKPPREDAFPYHLVLKDSQGERVEPGAILRAGETYGMGLTANPADLTRPVTPRYVYVFSIDSFGASVLLFPPLGQGNVENRFPTLFEGATAFPTEIPLGPQPSFRATEPFGIDAFFLLTTEEPIPNPWVLHASGVRSRGPDGQTSLEELLSQRGSTRRGNPPTTPVTWSIEWRTFECRPSDL